VCKYRQVYWTGKAVKVFMTVYRQKCDVGLCFEDYDSRINYWERFCGMKFIYHMQSSTEGNFCPVYNYHLSISGHSCCYTNLKIYNCERQTSNCKYFVCGMKIEESLYFMFVDFIFLHKN
jgi:hypothetical protein